MLKLILSLLNLLLGFEQQNNRVPDLHRKPEPVKSNALLIILASCLIAFIIFIVFMIFIGHCTDSGVYYNAYIY